MRDPSADWSSPHFFGEQRIDAQRAWPITKLHPAREPDQNRPGSRAVEASAAHPTARSVPTLPRRVVSRGVCRDGTEPVQERDAVEYLHGVSVPQPCEEGDRGGRDQKGAEDIAGVMHAEVQPRRGDRHGEDEAADEHDFRPLRAASEEIDSDGQGHRERGVAAGEAPRAVTCDERVGKVVHVGAWLGNDEFECLAGEPSSCGTTGSQA